MSNVHEAITAHSKKQNAIVTKFAALEEKREALIEKAVLQCRQSEPFSVNGIIAISAMSLLSISVKKFLTET